MDTPEPVFGIIKSAMGFRQFSLRGIDKVKGEWAIVTMARNVKRMFTPGVAWTGDNPPSECLPSAGIRVLAPEPVDIKKSRVQLAKYKCRSVRPTGCQGHDRGYMSRVR